MTPKRIPCRVAAAALGVVVLAVSDARGGEVEDLRSQVEAQSELLSRQADALELMEDRVRVLEDEKLGAGRAPVGGSLPDDYQGQGGGVHRGVEVAEAPWGSFNFKFYTYVRYLNQKALDDEYENAFGKDIALDRRQDFQLQKAKIDTYGWVVDPRLTYLLYVWSANSSQGQGAQVVVAGFLQYKFHDSFVLGGGITALPGTRTTTGNFPQWMGVDNRLIADEFFRPSYTTGIWAKGTFLDDFSYMLMLGNNLSTLGVDAGQLDAGLNTVSGVLSWEPLGAYGLGFGDFEHHEDPVTRVGLHYTRSREDSQSQSDTDTFDNTQIRFSDGTVIFEPGIFGEGVQIREVTYHMVSVDAGVKLGGWALEGEFFYRRLDDFHVRGGDVPFDQTDDYGVQAWASAMVKPKKLQAYVGAAKIFGEFGDPWDVRVGLNYFPFATKAVRWNNEVMYLNESPVGGIAYPYAVGGTGFVFQSNFEVAF